MSKLPRLFDTALSSLRFGLSESQTPWEMAASIDAQTTAGEAGQTRVAKTAALSIPCPMVSAEQQRRDRSEQRGQFLARQDRWQDLAAEMGRVDRARDVTDAGMPLADLLSYGARADVVQTVERALNSRRHTNSDILLAGIEALEGVLAENDNDMMLASLVAQAHMDIGWAWRNVDRKRRLPARNLEAFMAHFDRAIDILAPFDIKTAASPHLAAASCALHAAGPLPGRRVEADFEQLITLDPANPAPFRAMGNYLSPRWHGSYDALELQARRIAAQTQPTWGAGGYTWVLFDCLPRDSVACANLDLDFFVEGLGDILTFSPGQHQVNLLAAYCAQAGRNAFTDTAEAQRASAGIAGCLDWIVRDHLCEVHPLIWAHAAAGFDNNLRVASAQDFAATGLRDALQSIEQVFAPEIASGLHITFTPGGYAAKPALDPQR